MKLNTDLDLTEELKEPLPKGTYILEYVRDAFSNSDTIIDIYCKVISSDCPNQEGQECKIQTCYSSSNKQLVAIGNSIRNQIFKACIGKDLFDAESKKGGINTAKLYGLKFRCNIDIKEVNYGFAPFKNKFSGFKCVYSDEELLEIAKQRFLD